MKRRASPAAVGLLVIAVACSAPGFVAEGAETFVLASTTSTQDSGLLDAITPAFEEAFPEFRAKVVAVGSGEAMDLGRRGDADLLLVHSPDDELEFMNEGRGVFRKPVMRNDFLIAGPPEDPALVAEAESAADAFARIGNSPQTFVSRGDESGTHKKELKTWDFAGLDPGGDWYLQSGQGMAETITIASERNGYLLTDSATFTVMMKKIKLASLFKGDPAFTNPYSVIPVVGARERQAALAFAGWITGPDGQSFIANFGRREYGAPLFVATGR